MGAAMQLEHYFRAMKHLLTIGHRSLPCSDAIKSMRLFNLHRHIQSQPELWQQMQEKLLTTTPEPSFAKKNPSFEGVCMGNRKTCTCGAPFFG